MLSVVATVDDLDVPATFRGLRDDGEGERSSVGARISIQSRDVNGVAIGTQTAVGAGQGGAVVVGVCHLDADASCGCC